MGFTSSNHKRNRNFLEMMQVKSAPILDSVTNLMTSLFNRLDDFDHVETTVAGLLSFLGRFGPTFMMEFHL